MNTVADLVLVGFLAVVWLTAGLLADAMPAARTARQLRQRAAAVSIMVGAGISTFVVIALFSALARGNSAAPAAALLSAVPAVFALTMALPRVTRVRRGAGAFTAAPRTPVPPALRAAAAHPMLTTPPQVTGLAALVGLPVAARLVAVPGTEIAGFVFAVLTAAVVAVAIRAGVRHSRLNVQALAPIRTSRSSPPIPHKPIPHNR